MLYLLEFIGICYIYWNLLEYVIFIGIYWNIISRIMIQFRYCSEKNVNRQVNLEGLLV